MRGIDVSSWQSALMTLFGILLVTLISIGIRMLVMMTVQQRRERMNRQINERLKILIAAYKVLGGSFTGTLTVDPTHLRELRQQLADPALDNALPSAPVFGAERRRQIRDLVEAALSDIILLGTEEHVRLATAAVQELVAGRPVQTHDLVVSLRVFIRQALDLEPLPADIVLPTQGPARPASSSSRKKEEREGDKSRSAAGGSGSLEGGGTGTGGLGDMHHGSGSETGSR